MGDDRTALEAVVLENEELVKLWQDAQRLQDMFLEDGVDYEMDNDEKIVDFYEKLQEIESDASGEQD